MANIDRLKSQLKELHESLNKVQSLDDETEGLIRKILDDIEDLENRSMSIDENNTNDWEAILLSIENQYPNFSHAVRAIVDTLGKMGI